MTPLASYLMKRQVLMPARKREPYDDPEDCLKLIESEVHYFEISDTLEIAEELYNKVIEGLPTNMGGRIRLNSSQEFLALRAQCKNLELQNLIFLPAPKTWLEWFSPALNKRFAALIIDSEDLGRAEVFCFSKKKAYHGISIIQGTILNIMRDGVNDLQIMSELHRHLIGNLILINSPKLFGRVTHVPHRGLESRLTTHFGVGKFPLRAWTELKLEVTKPLEIDDGEPHEAHLTGRRALHFVRKHIRIRLGKLEYVTSHWRGDAAIGIKQTRYKVVT